MRETFIPQALQDRFAVVLVRPESAENVGLVARAMKNTGFRHLRLVGREKSDVISVRTAVHSADILQRAAFFSDLGSAVADLQLVFASTARRRKNFPCLAFEDAVSRMVLLDPWIKVGLLFGNERTGLTSDELGFSNFRFTIPQASPQPSYNLGGAVLLTLFEIFRRASKPSPQRAFRSDGPPLPQREQQKCIDRILAKLENRGFIQPANRRHTSEMIRDLFGRLAMTDRDRRLLLALFS